MPIRIGQQSDHGFDEPLGLLSDCHRRIEHFLEVLTKMANQAAHAELIPANRNALEGAIKYFAVAAPRHTADEEDSLFPRLRNSHDPAAAEALAALDTLEQDHDEAEQHHAAVDDLVRRWLADGNLSPADVDGLRDRLARLQAIYGRHIAVEDQQIFPAAARVLDREQIEQIGGEMAARRHVVRRDLPGNE
jgi:hemerythrin-like domain-containing protein